MFHASPLTLCGLPRLLELFGISWIAQVSPQPLSPGPYVILLVYMSMSDVSFLVIGHPSYWIWIHHIPVQRPHLCLADYISRGAGGLDFNIRIWQDTIQSITSEVTGI